jgi:hypothetical protein
MYFLKITRVFSKNYKCIFLKTCLLLLHHHLLLKLLLLLLLLKVGNDHSGQWLAAHRWNELSPAHHSLLLGSHVVRHLGVNVMVSILSDFCGFSAGKMALF